MVENNVPIFHIKMTAKLSAYFELIFAARNKVTGVRKIWFYELESIQTMNNKIFCMIRGANWGGKG